MMGQVQSGLVDELPLHPGLLRFSNSSTTRLRETGAVVFIAILLQIDSKFDTGQGAAHSGQKAWERAQYANEPSQFKQQTGVVPRQPHAPPAACTFGLRSWAVPMTNTNAIAAIVRILFMVGLLCGLGWTQSLMTVER